MLLPLSTAAYLSDDGRRRILRRDLYTTKSIGTLAAAYLGSLILRTGFYNQICKCERRGKAVFGVSG
jgi:hypothetical protein